MKQFLVFLLLVISTSVFGQTATSVNNYSETFSNFKSELGSGNFVYNIPLFSLDTDNANFTFTGNMWYNAQAASTVFTSETPLSRGWSFDFIPTIARNIDTENSLWDEKYYQPNTNDANYFVPGYARPTREYNDLFEFNVFGISGAFRLVYNSNNIDVDIVDCNSAIEIIPTYTLTTNGNGKNINLISFTLIDEKGYRYEFSEAEEARISQRLDAGYSQLLAPFFNLNGGLFVGGLPYKKAFLIKNVYDNHNTHLIQYNYKSTPTNFSYQNYNQTYIKKEIENIDIKNKGILSFDLQNSYVRSIIVDNIHNERIKKINIEKSNVSFYNTQNVLAERYLFSYYQGTASNQHNNYGNPLKQTNLSTFCIDDSARYNNEVQDYTKGVLKTITTPTGGKMEIEYENNTYYLYNLGSGIGLPLGNEYLSNMVNYQYVEVPVSYNSSTKRYSFYYEVNANIEGYYIKFDSQFYDNPNLNPPQAFYPGIQILNVNGTVFQGFDYLKLCEYGTKINPLTQSRTVEASAALNYTSYVSNVKVYKRILKPANQLSKHLFGPSIRVKKITALNESNDILNEKNYSYQDINDPSMSSGCVSEFLWDLYARSYVYGLKPYPVFYKYITVEETNKGKSVYELNIEQFQNTKFGVPQVAFQPKNIWKYNANNQLIEAVSNTFEYFTISSDPSAKNQFKKINSNISTYEGSKIKTMTSERSFDIVTRMLKENIITDPTVGETFTETYTYQKLGNATFQTTVEKTKNSNPLNKSVFAYQQHGSSQVYNLHQTQIAKESRPLELEREVTLYDDFGNVLEYKTKDGMLVSQIWGYNNSKLVVELKNIAYSDIDYNFITNIHQTSSASNYDETTLMQLFADLRNNYDKAFVTSYTYKLLVGITTITDANGRTETYQYDAYNRLYRVLNHDGLITKEYIYNIKN